MKFLPLAVMLFFLQPTLAQYRIDPSVQQEFETLLRKQPKAVQELRKDEYYQEGISLALVFKEDTVNIKDFIQIDTSLKIFSIDKDGKEIPEAKKPKDLDLPVPFFSCKSGYWKDTLSIGSFAGIFSAHGFAIKLIGDKTVSEFLEFSDLGAVLRLKLTDKKTDLIRVNAQAENIVLSTVPKKIGDTFYGKATVVTVPYYSDNEDFTSGFIQKRYIITYLFTSKLVDLTKDANEN